MIDPAMLLNIGVAPSANPEPEAGEGFSELMLSAMAGSLLPQPTTTDVAPDVAVQTQIDPSLELADVLSAGAEMQTAASTSSEGEDGAIATTSLDGSANTQGGVQGAGQQGKAATRGESSAAARLPEQALRGKTASAAWHAAASSQASATSAVRFAQAPVAEQPAAAIVEEPAEATATDSALLTGGETTETEIATSTLQAAVQRNSSRSALPLPQQAADTATAAIAAAGKPDVAPAPSTREAGAAKLAALARSNTSEQGMASATGTHVDAAAAAKPTDVPAPVVPASTLATVLRAVEALEHRPPPRTMAIDVPAEGPNGEAMRLVISVRGDVVHISTPQGLPAHWNRDLAAAFAQRGLSLAGENDSNNNRDNRNDQRRDDVPRPAAAGTYRAERRVADGALRL